MVKLNKMTFYAVFGLVAIYTKLLLLMIFPALETTGPMLMPVILGVSMGIIAGFLLEAFKITK